MMVLRFISGEVDAFQHVGDVQDRRRSMLGKG